METSVRYIVDNTAMAIEFYELLEFEVVAHPGPGFAMLRRDGLRLLLNTPGGGGGGRLPDPVYVPPRSSGRAHNVNYSATAHSRSFSQRPSTTST